MVSELISYTVQSYFVAITKNFSMEGCAANLVPQILTLLTHISSHFNMTLDIRLYALHYVIIKF